ncbi:hypothetical protein GCM10010399_79390 [Dactylosporangium fulvum]|uniref:SHOCT domain-containing protein n=1 Tax=Dactylosporangium fulvum TaxID=53359 RepID=A0ABY5W2I4_9ACTN|nr:hypothetical protein [Dactylosporangium fulvum]UWP84213.1 hypothetical protein Dfulv_08230 [Dactylosporangium fulvum]
MPLPLLIRRSGRTVVGLAGAFVGLAMLFLTSRAVFATGGDGVAVGRLVCGVIFLALGAGPFLLLDKEFWRSTLRTGYKPPEPVVLLPLAVPAPGKTPREAAGREHGRVLEVLDARGPAEPPRPVGADPGKLASALERLGRLHGAGELTDAEIHGRKAAAAGHVSWGGAMSRTSAGLKICPPVLRAAAILGGAALGVVANRWITG